MNTILWVLTTGSRWCDVPVGKQWASRSASHRWLGYWKETGHLRHLLEGLQEMAHVAKMIDWERLSVDGFFSAGKGGEEKIAYGYKGKGTTTHLLVDGQGNPLCTTSTSAVEDERQEVVPLIKKNHTKPEVNMSMVSASDCNNVHSALARHLDDLENQTKTSDFQGDMLSVAKKVYENLQSLMQKEKGQGLDPDLIDLTLNIVKGKFYSPFGIAKDLQYWLQHPTHSPDPSHHVWYDLCVGGK